MVEYMTKWSMIMSSNGIVDHPMEDKILSVVLLVDEMHSVIIQHDIRTLNTLGVLQELRQS